MVNLACARVAPRLSPLKEVALNLQLLLPMLRPHLLGKLAVAEGGSPEVEEYPLESGMGGVLCGAPAIGQLVMIPDLDLLLQMEEKRLCLPKFVEI